MPAFFCSAFTEARVLVSSLLAAVMVIGPAQGDAPPSGANLFKTNCARCHGNNGEGTKRYPKRLEGDRSVAQLAGLIRKTMPEDAPGTLSEPEASSLAQFVFDGFYSPLARERLKPARIEMARLTVNQYRNAISDLIGSFRWQPTWGDKRGLKGEYFKGRNPGSRNRVLERIDPQVVLDFGTTAPHEKLEAHEFSLRWSGSLLVPVTGEFEFVVRTEHAARLWINDTRTPLIDAWVKSGNDKEYRGKCFLTAGRMVPVRLEYTKAKQGVDDSKKNKDKKPAQASSIALLWQLPHRPVEPIPARNLSPNPSPESFTCTAPFPPDDRSYGWERGTTVSREWDQATTEAALEAATYIQDHLQELAGSDKAGKDRQEKWLDFCRKFAERAFRRPLTPDQEKLIERLIRTAKDPETGIKRVVLMTLKSPRFLYREMGEDGDGYDVASRLSFGLWDSLPDRQLLELAAKGKLGQPEEVRRQAERMLVDLRARNKLHHFLMTWLRADQPADIAKDPGKYPGFDRAVLSDMKTSLELFLDEVVWSDASDFRALLRSDEVYLNDRLAKFFGVSPPEGGGFRKVKLDGGRRAGILSHPYLMTNFAYTRESSPIHRGVFLARGILGVSLRTPPEAAAPIAADLHPGLTTRERVALQTRPTTCMTCHEIINPLGFSLENFDAVGKYRDKDNGKPVDATGAYQARDGKRVEMTGVRELANFVIQSPESQAAFVEQMFHFLVQQPVRAYGPFTLEELRKSFEEEGFHIRKLAMRIMIKTATKSRKLAWNDPVPSPLKWESSP